jgi:dephospho-CoA kinase
MQVWGLTGNIACGKSLVEDVLSSAGVPVIDADQVARIVVSPGQQALTEIVETFGEGVLSPAGELDRAALGEIVFSDAAARKRLEDIVHPRIHGHIGKELAKLAEEDTPLAVVSAALMIESGSYQAYAGVLVVSCPEDVQAERLRLRDGFDDAQVAARIASQMPQAEKIARADQVIDNGGSIQQTERQVTAWLSSLKEAL